jgi:hypothetical protein
MMLGRLSVVSSRNVTIAVCFICQEVSCLMETVLP